MPPSRAAPSLRLAFTLVRSGVLKDRLMLAPPYAEYALAAIVKYVYTLNIKTKKDHFVYLIQGL